MAIVIQALYKCCPRHILWTSQCIPLNYSTLSTYICWELFLDFSIDIHFTRKVLSDTFRDRFKFPLQRLTVTDLLILKTVISIVVAPKLSKILKHNYSFYNSNQIIRIVNKFHISVEFNNKIFQYQATYVIVYIIHLMKTKKQEDSYNISVHNVC